MASAERRREVLLIDADLRRPRLHERFHLPNQIGLTTLLERMEPVDAMDSAFMDSLVQPTQIPHLFIMTAGPTDHASPDRLYSANLDVLLRYLERRFDLILIDTPPLMMYSDARVLGRAAEGLVMVVRANKKSREELRMAYQKLVQDRIPVIGTILNDWNIESSQARAYNKYYNHYQQQSS
jgi:capsular exopolysaccharide synthesis family protein